jgi:5'(3')-deoxyribonucleotidase
MTKPLEQLIENIILEEMSTNRYTIYCDMDGVLCDFENSALKLINDTIKVVKDDHKRLSQLIPDNKNFEYKRFKLVRKLIEKGHGEDWNKPVTSLDAYKVRPLMYFLIGGSVRFWSNMNWAQGGHQLWSFIEPYKPIILSSPAGSRSVIGKKEWCQTELGLSGDRVIITPDKGIDTGNKLGILIDDRDKSLNQFHGFGIKYETGNPEPAINKLKEFGFK